MLILARSKHIKHSLSIGLQEKNIIIFKYLAPTIASNCTVFSRKNKMDKLLTIAV